MTDCFGPRRGRETPAPAPVPPVLLFVFFAVVAVIVDPGDDGVTTRTAELSPAPPSPRIDVSWSLSRFSGRWRRLGRRGSSMLLPVGEIEDEVASETAGRVVGSEQT